MDAATETEEVSAEGSGAAKGGGHDALLGLGLLESEWVRNASMLVSGASDVCRNAFHNCL